MSLSGSTYYWFDTRYQVSSLIIAVSIALSVLLFDSLGLIVYWPIAVVLGIILGILMGYILFDWNRTSEIDIESEQDRKIRVAEQRALIDFSTCMSCTKPLVEEEKHKNRDASHHHKQ